LGQYLPTEDSLQLGVRLPRSEQPDLDLLELQQIDQLTDGLRHAVSLSTPLPFLRHGRQLRKALLSSLVVLVALGQEPLELCGDLIGAGHPLRFIELQAVVLLLESGHQFLHL